MQDASARFRIADDENVGYRMPTVAVTFFYDETGVFSSVRMDVNQQLSADQFDALVALVKRHRKFGETH